MPSPTWTRLVIALAAGLWFALALVADAPVDAKWLQPVGAIMALVVLILLAFDRWAWRWLPEAWVQRPDLNGTWRAVLQFESPEGAVQRKDCFLVIEQTYSDISVDMLFDISRSDCRSAAIEQSRRNQYSLWWSYWSAAAALDRGGNPPHRGAAELHVTMEPAIRMSGDYWTERKTRGSILTTGRSRRQFRDFASAASARYDCLDG